MRVSVCITLFNEEKSIKALLESLLTQSKKPDEIVIVDGGSTDKTVNIIKNFRNKKIRLIKQKSTRSAGRNLSAKLAKNEIIAMTDGDCIAKKDWLERLTAPFMEKKNGVVAGFYEMTAKNAFQKAAGYFLGITSERYNVDKFLPSTRSIAFRKNIWQKIGGFPESDNNRAEDTDFNYKAIKAGVKFVRVREAKVEWRIPDNISEFAKKIYQYAKWDAEYGIWWNPVQKFASHNIKVLLVFLRYLVGIFLLILSLNNDILLLFLFFGVIIYTFYAFYKIYKSASLIKAGLWGVLLQYLVDISVMRGFITGFINRFRFN